MVSLDFVYLGIYNFDFFPREVVIGLMIEVVTRNEAYSSNNTRKGETVSDHKWLEREIFAM